MNNKNDKNYIYYLVVTEHKIQRKLKGLTQSQFTELCNYSDGFIMNIESDKYHQTFSLGTIWKFTQILNIDIRELLKPIDEERPELTKEEREEVNIQIKYEGYIKLQLEQIEAFKKLEQKKIPENIDYEDVKGIRIEARQKLEKFKPTSIGQASRISGISPADISVLLIYMQTLKGEKAE